VRTSTVIENEPSLQGLMHVHFISLRDAGHLNNSRIILDSPALEAYSTALLRSL